MSKNLGLKICLIIILLMGVFFRLDNLDKKVYWHDEVYTSLRISGYNGDMARDAVFTGEIVKPSDLVYFQRLNDDRGWKETWQVLAEHPEHPPLYYVLARLWSQLWGSSITTTRSLAAIFSILVLPALFWLCWELFPNSLVGWWAIALVSISPIHVLYAQEARQYSLWSMTTLLACAAFWRAIKASQPQLKDWLLYSFTLALNFYTSVLSIFLVIAQAIYLICTAKITRSQVILWFLVAVSLAGIIFLPWLLVIPANLAKLKQQTEWINVNEPWLTLYSLWELHLSSIWIDFPTEINHILAPRIFFILLLAVIYLIYFLRKKTQETLFLSLVIIIPILGLILPDLLIGGRRSSMTRYFFPSILGIQIALSYWLAFSKTNKLKLTIITLIFSLGVISCSLSNSAYTWWNKISGYHNNDVARVINNSPKPLLISDTNEINVGNLISLSHLLNDQVDLLLYRNTAIPAIPEGYSDIFFYNPSAQLISNLEGYVQTSPELAGFTNPNLLLVWSPTE
ncbi:MAG: hypothetical protein EA365_04140 [Gloeocapsa sp. DLM2.Bin57]|nr:MAG: hypothetical protein EA365_04140 [Gloeocapsa sp. DLM2.Bin57]